uniref:Uncharacterized protein n=1 Tax=Timema douglasi TaxID=61478 RepID=A0A7R8W1L5_TIMDO|nr:unnamed protein product [Timema douglasi]
MDQHLSEDPQEMNTCQILTAALLVTCLAGGESSRSPSPRLQFNFNKYVDTLVTKIRTSAPDMGLDPLPLPDVNKTLTVVGRPGPLQPLCPETGLQSIIERTN